MTLTPTLSVDSRVSAFAIASIEPCTSALSTTLTSLTSPDLILSRMFSSDTRPVPGYEQGAPAQAAPPPQYGQPQKQAPVIVRQDSGLGHVIAGAVLVVSAAASGVG